VFLLAGTAFIMFMMLYIYKELSSKQRFKMLSLKNKKILDAQTSIVLITDGMNIIDANKKLLLYFGYKSLEEFKKDHICICELFEKNNRFFSLNNVVDEQTWVESILKLPYKDHIVAMKDANGQQNIFFVSISSFDKNKIISFSNISDTMTEHFSLLERVVHDQLTGAYNRDYFHTRKDLWVQEVEYKELELGVIILDIDHFKDVNDTYGHNCGDLILKRLVKLIDKTIRKEDMLIRWGGEEFIIVSYVSSLDNLYNIAENIRKKVESEKFEEVGNVTCSFGVTLYTNEPIEQTIERADQALYEAKKDGRNRVVKK
jgi:diguanylate cyclase (GGDEF)-like protein